MRVWMCHLLAAPAAAAAVKWRELTWGFLPLGQISDSSLIAVYRPPKPPPRMQMRGLPLLVLVLKVSASVLEAALLSTRRC